MIVDVIQCLQDRYSSEFQILRGNKQIGDMSLKGGLGRREVTWNIQLYDQLFHMDYCGKLFSSAKKFRPYTITTSNTDRGCIYQTVTADKKKNSFTYHYMMYDDKVYKLYPIGFGEEGAHCPIYSDQGQIAQIDKSGLVYNELHHYRLYAIDENSTLLAILFCSYMYTVGCYEPGVKVTKSVRKNFTITKNTILLAKYDMNFVSLISE